MLINDAARHLRISSPLLKVRADAFLDWVTEKYSQFDPGSRKENFES